MEPIILFVIVALIIVFGVLYFFIKKIPVSPDQALIRFGGRSDSNKVIFNSAYVAPFLHSYKIIDLSSHNLNVLRIDGESLQCQDGIRIDVEVSFEVRVEKSKASILNVATNYPSFTLGNYDTAIKDIFEDLFISSLNRAANSLTYDEINNYDSFISRIRYCLPNRNKQNKDEETILNDVNYNGFVIGEISVKGFKRIDLDNYNENDPKDREGKRNAQERINSQVIIEEQSKKNEEIERQRIKNEIEQARLESIKKDQERKLEKIKVEEHNKREQEKLLLESAKTEIDHKLRIQEANMSSKVEEQRLKNEMAIQELQNKLAFEEASHKNQLELKEIEKAKIEKDRAIENEIAILELENKLALEKASHENESNLKEIEKEKIERDRLIEISLFESEVNNSSTKAILQKDKRLKEAEIELELSRAKKDIELDSLALDLSKSLKEEDIRLETKEAQIRRELKENKLEHEKAKELKENEIELIELNYEKTIKETEFKGKSYELLINVADREEAKILAEERAITTKEIEIAKRAQEVSIINAKRETDKETALAQSKADMEAYRIRKIAEAKLDESDVNHTISRKDAEAINLIGKAEAEVEKLKLDARNIADSDQIKYELIQQLIPIMPSIIEKLMIPAEKIESIKLINVNGLSNTGENPNINNQFSQILNILLNAGLTLPIIKEIISAYKDSPDIAKILNGIKRFPLGEKLIEQIRPTNEDDSEV